MWLTGVVWSKQRYNHEYMRPRKATLLIVVLLFPVLAFSADKPEVSPEEATKHLKKKAEPAYPSEPLVRVRGDVVLQVEISDSGAVTAIKAISGHPMLIAAAIDAVRMWHYSPFMLNGKAIAVKTTVTIPFGPPRSREEAIAESNKSDLFFKTMDLCRKQIRAKELSEAENTCRQTIKLSTELDPSRQLEQMEAVQQTGHALFLQRKFPEALQQYETELQIGIKTLKPYEAELAAAQYHVGNGLWGTGRLEEARLQYEKAESTYRQAAQHIESAFLKNEYAKQLKRILADHAALLRQMNRSTEADALDKEAAAIVIRQDVHDD
jgi:TonB family protein